MEQQTDAFVCVLNQSENSKCNLILGWFNKISKTFFCVRRLFIGALCVLAIIQNWEYAGQPSHVFGIFWIEFLNFNNFNILINIFFSNVSKEMKNKIIENAKNMRRLTRIWVSLPTFLAFSIIFFSYLIKHLKNYIDQNIKIIKVTIR